MVDIAANLKGVILRVSETRKYQRELELVKGQGYDVDEKRDKNELFLTPKYYVTFPSKILRMVEVIERPPWTPKPGKGLYYSYILRNGKLKVPPPSSSSVSLLTVL